MPPIGCAASSSKSLWGDACQAVGREQAAIAIAIISAKQAEHFRSTPGGYSTAWCGEGEGWRAQSRA
jgi:Replication protein C C-terminal region